MSEFNNYDFDITFETPYGPKRDIVRMTGVDEKDARELVEICYGAIAVHSVKLIPREQILKEIKEYHRKILFPDEWKKKYGDEPQ